MTESEIMVQVSLNDEAMWFMMQWWVSLSFGLIALAHFGRKYLTLPLVILLSLIYVAGTAVSVTVVRIYLFSNFLYFDDLRALTMAQGTEQYIRLYEDPWHGAFIAIASIGIFIGAILYFIYRYRDSKRSEQS